MPICDNCNIHESVIIPQPTLVNLFECTIGARTKVAAGVEIGRAIIGADCKIEFGAFICAGVKIEDEVFVGPNVTFCNDKHPRASNKAFVPEVTLVKRGASIGAGAIILPGLVLGEDCQIGAGAVVTHDIPAGAIVVGVPADNLQVRINQPLSSAFNL